MLNLKYNLTYKHSGTENLTNYKYKEKEMLIRERHHSLNYLIKTIIFSIIFLINFSSICYSSQFYTKDHLVIDLATGVEWMRCSVGQRWDNQTCVGSIVNLNHELMPQVLEQAIEQLGEGWRLPTRTELESLVCMECGIPKIDTDIFPKTEPVPYWTGQQNNRAKKHYWSVNFYTGYSYGRFFPFQNLAVRLVRNR